MFTIAKTFRFEAAHCLDHLPEGHPCRSVHGHSYTVVVQVKCEHLNTDGMVIDFHDLKPVGQWLKDHVDHTNLNDVCPYPTTSEHLARWFFEVFQLLMTDTMGPYVDGRFISAVTVSETGKTWARYEP